MKTLSAIGPSAVLLLAVLLTASTGFAASTDHEEKGLFRSIRSLWAGDHSLTTLGTSALSSSGSASSASSGSSSSSGSRGVGGSGGSGSGNGSSTSDTSSSSGTTSSTSSTSSSSGTTSSTSDTSSSSGTTSSTSSTSSSSSSSSSSSGVPVVYWNDYQPKLHPRWIKDDHGKWLYKVPEPKWKEKNIFHDPDGTCTHVCEKDNDMPLYDLKYCKSFESYYKSYCTYYYDPFSHPWQLEGVQVIPAHLLGSSSSTSGHGRELKLSENWAPKWPGKEHMYCHFYYSVCGSYIALKSGPTSGSSGSGSSSSPGSIGSSSSSISGPSSGSSSSSGSISGPSSGSSFFA